VLIFGRGSLPYVRVWEKGDVESALLVKTVFKEGLPKGGRPKQREKQILRENQQ